MSIIKYRINKKFSSIPFEKGDFISLVWKSIQKKLKNYDFNSNVCIKNYLINCAYNYYLREVIKFCKNKELVMNNVLSYESLSEKNVFIKSNDFIKLKYEDHVKDFISDLIKENNSFDTNQIKKVIYLRSLGYSAKEIAKITKYKINKILKIIEFAIKIAKRNY